MPGLSLSILGPYATALDGQPLPGFRTRLAQALFIYLACEPERHRREHLMALFWPGLPQASAQQNLRQNLYLLRRAIPEVAAVSGEAAVPLVLADSDTLQLNPAAAVVVDARRFAALIDRIRPGLGELEEAVALYRGDFLVDFYLPDSNPFEEWAAARREAYRRGVLLALERLAAIHLTDEAFEAAEAYARRQLVIDPLHEAGNRQLIELLARSGRRSAALAHFDDYRRLLNVELGVRPGSETLALVSAVQGGELLPAARRPDHIRGYDIHEELGRGSYGVVFRASQPAIGRDVAVKVIPARYADDVAFIRRFEAEAQTIARLEHPQIVPLYDYWREPGSAYLVMRYLRGGNLKAALDGAPWPLERAARMVEQLAAALSVAHRHGVVHRDVKPANILLDEDGNAYLTDFGIAKLLRPEGGTNASHEMFAGTPEYVSPEQALSEPVTPQSDQYSLGLVVYEALSGRPPFSAGSLLELLEKHARQPVPPLRERRPDVPAALDEVLGRALAKRPAERFPDVAAFAAAFVAANAAASRAAPGGPLSVAPGQPLLTVDNPYKGLLAFTEADAALFYGREALTQQLVSRLAEAGDHARFLAVVGPSGSGKSSLVKAGLVPALRRGVLPGADKWFILDMIPGAHPFEELETALLRIAVNPPVSLLEQLQDGERGLLRAVRRTLPPDGDGQLLLIIDQFEELFTLVADREVTARFLDGLVAAVSDPRSPLRVIATLRADFYDRPLLYSGLSELVQQRTEVVVPMATDELVRAVERPAARVGVAVQPELVAALVADVNEQPGALPLLQYTLSELFEGRADGRLTLDAYRRLGGISGALAQRADAVYDALDDAGQSAARALFSRLVTLGEGVEDTRRRVLRSELDALDVGGRPPTTDGRPPTVDEATSIVRQGATDDESQAVVRGLSSVVGRQESPQGGGRRSAVGGLLDAFGHARLLAFDRDPATRGPTVEIAHEALLRAWPRLRGWLDEDRAALRLSRLLTVATTEWQAAGRADGFLLRGARLDQLAPLAGGTVALTEDERRLLDASLTAREARRAAEEARRQTELATAQKLAETERRRADEQAGYAGRLRRRAALLAGAMGLAIILAVAALLLGRQANESATLAQANAAVAQTAEAQAVGERATAEAERARAEAGEEAALAAEATAAAEADVRATAEAVAIRERETAEEQTRLATSRELALASQTTLDIDTELSLLLALRALETAETKDAVEALHQAVQAARTLRTIDHPDPSWDTVVRGPDGPLPATVSETEITLWDPETMEPLYVLPGAGFDPELYPRIHMDQAGERVQLIQMPWEDDWIDYRAWTLDNEQRVISQTLPIRLDVISFPPFSPDGQLLAVNYEDGTVGLWDSNTGQQVALLSANDERLSPPVFDQDGDRLATFSSRSDQISIWDVAASVAAGSGQRLTTFTAPDLSTNGDLSSFAFIDETTVAAGSSGGWLQIWDLSDTSAPLATQVAHNSAIYDIEVSHDRTKIATSSQAAIKLWSVPRGDLLLTLPIGVDEVYEVYFSPDGTELTTRDDRGGLRIWDARPYPLGETVSFEQRHVNGLSHEMQVSPDGRQLAITSDFMAAALWDAASGEVLKILEDGEGATYGAGYSPDGARLATVGQDDRIRIWDLANNEVALTFLGESSGTILSWEAGIFDVAYSPDGSRLVTAGGNGVAKVWDAQTGEELLTLIGHTGGVYDVVYSPDGRLIATAGSEDGAVRLWDAETGEENVVIEPKGEMVWAFAFSPDGSRLATGTRTAGAQVWDTTTGEKIYSFDRAGNFVPDLAYTPDGQHIITAGSGGLKVWRAENGEEVLTLNDDHIWWLTISSDGRTVYTVDFRDVARGFTLQLEDTIALAHDRLTRWWRPEECLAYLHTEECPPAPERFAANE